MIHKELKVEKVKQSEIIVIKGSALVTDVVEYDEDSIGTAEIALTRTQCQNLVYELKAALDSAS